MVSWWIGTAKARELQPERQKAQASYTPIPPKQRENPRLYGLTQDCEIYTPQGVVEALAGDLLFVTDSELWVLPPEKVPLGWAIKIVKEGT